MKQLLQKSALFFSILILIKIPFFLFYEDEPMYRKSQVAREEFNTVFIGSSRTKFDIIPAYFDSLTKEKTKSYNFGVAYGLPPQTFFWCEELMRENPSLKYIFFELSGGLNKSEGYRETWSEFYFADYSRVIKNLNFKGSLVYHDKLVAGFFKPSFSHRENRIDHNIPLEKVFEAKELKAKAVISQQFVRETYRLNLLVENENYHEASINELYWDSITRLIELAESKQIRIYFFIPPRIESENELKMIHPIYKKLDKKYKVSVAHFDEMFYRDETSIDDSHLNHKGAMQFTKYMAEAFNKHSWK